MVECHRLLLHPLVVPVLQFLLVVEGVRLGHAGPKVDEEQVRVAGQIAPAEVTLDRDGRPAGKAGDAVGDAPRLHLAAHDFQELS